MPRIFSMQLAIILNLHIYIIIVNKEGDNPSIFIDKNHNIIIWAASIAPIAKL